VRIEFPEPHAGAWIESDDAVVGRAEEELSLDEDGGGLESGLFAGLDRLLHVARAVGPRHLESVTFVRSICRAGNSACRGIAA